jgi:uncharacterized protein YceK
MKHTVALLSIVVVCLAGCSSARTKTSPKAWAAVSEGMMKEQIVDTLGQPASQSSSGQVWQKEGWELHIAYDERGRATRLVRQLVMK